MTALLVTVRIDGTEVVTDFAGTITGTGVEFLDFGVATVPVDDAQRSFRNIKVGTTGWGSSDLFAPSLTSPADFSSGVIGAASGSVTVASGEMDIAQPPHGAAVGRQDLGSAVSDIYIQFDYKRNRAAGDGDGDYLFVYDEGFNNIDGFSLGGGSGDDIAGDIGWGPLVGAGPADGVWQTIAFHYVIGGTPPPVPLSVDDDSFTVSTVGPLTVNVSTDAAGWDGTDTSIALTLTGLPASGITASFSPASIAPGGTSVLTINVNGGAVAGTYTLTLTGTGSTGDVFTVPITVVVDLPAGVGYDTVDSSVQVGGDMESADYNSIEWEFAVPDANHGRVADVAGPAMIQHLGTTYVAHIEPDVSLPPQVHYYDPGTDAWVAINPAAAMLAEYGSFSNHFFVWTGVALASDGTDLWMAHHWYEVISPPPAPFLCIGYMSLWKLSGGAWSFVDDQEVTSGVTLHYPDVQLAATAGRCYVVEWGGDTLDVHDTDGNAYGAPMDTYTDESSNIVYPPPRFVLDGGTPLLIAVYPEEPVTTASLDDFDLGYSLRVYDLSGALLAKKLEIDAIGPLAERPLDSRMSGVGSSPFVSDRYYCDLGGPLVTVSADGTTIGNVFGNLHYDWARSLSSGSVCWDATDGKLWIVDRLGLPVTQPVTILALQPPCAADFWPDALKWMTLLEGDTIDQPFYVPDGNRNTEIKLGASFIDGDYIYTAVTRCQVDGANPGDTSDPTFNGHIQVWKTHICRLCGGCPGVLAGGFHVWQTI